VILVDGGGHGVTGLAQAHAIETALRTAVSEFPATTLDPARVFESLNRMIAASPGRQTVACTYVGLDINSRKLAYINAGGPSPLLMLEPGRTVTAEQSSLVLGVDKGYHYETAILDLPASFRLVLFSDGVIDATNVEGEVLGEKRIRDTLESPTGFAAAAQISLMIGQLVRSHVGGTSGDDDASWLVLAHR
jgi:sigma-B regulation protein RsbU (phosphoserine phosphatase)